jgi:hypothetical protein
VKADTNLLGETLLALHKQGKNPLDVHWVGFRSGQVASGWPEFEAIARGTDYDSGYGWPEINIELVIVGDGWWLERHEYDGAERWEYQEPPILANGYLPLTTVTSR